MAAKRYLVGITPGDRAALSADSLRSLALQGGPMTPQVCARFLRQAHAADALRLRRWDELTKNPALRPESAPRGLAELARLMDWLPAP